MVEASRGGAVRKLRLTLGLDPALGATERRHVGIARGALTALGARGVGMLVSLLVVPVSVGYLGAERYGALMAIFSMLAWVTIADLGSLQVEVDVSESNLGQVRKGQPCELTLDALPGVRFRGAVHTVVPTADRSKASVMVKIRFVDSDSRILPEMSAKAAFLEREAGKDDLRPRTAVNPAALVTSDGREGLYRIKGGSVEFVPVTRGSRLGEMQEVGGVTAGDRVALRPLDRLKNGTRVLLPEKK